MGAKLLALYFLLGGTIIALVTYIGNQHKGLLAAFVATLPAITIVTLITIYLSSGPQAAVSFFKGMLTLMPAWVLYALAIVYLLPRWGLVPSLVVGVSLYLIGALVIMRVVR